MNQRERHLAELQALGYTKDTLHNIRILENIAHNDAELYCNGDIDTEESERRDTKMTERVKRLFGGMLPPGFFINGDPRGYALKIEQPANRRLISYIDWGGYGILAPDFDDER